MGTFSAPSLAPLRHPLFLAIWSAYLLSSIGTQVQSVGAAWTMTMLTDSPGKISLITTATALPMLLFAVPSGAIGDMFDRRRVLIVAQIIMLTAASILALCTLAGWTTPLLLISCTFIIGCGFALNAPSWQAMVRELVAPAEVPAAIAINSVAFNVGRIGGPAIGGIIVGTLGAGTAFVVNSISYVALVVVLLRWRRTAAPQLLPREPFISAIGSGLRYARHSHVVRRILWRDVIFGISSAGVLALLPLISLQRMGGGPFGYGLLLSALGIGSIVGGLAATPIRIAIGAPAMVRLAMAVSVLATALLAFAQQPWICWIGVFGAGWSTIVLLSTFSAAIQLSIPNWVMGRVLSLHQMALFGGLAAGSVLWGQVAARLSVELAIAGSALVGLLLLLLSLRLPISLTPSAQLDSVPPIERDPGLSNDEHELPLTVAIHYRIRTEDVPRFLAAMEQSRNLRRRDGAEQWNLLHASDDPSLWIEQFRNGSWASHVRYRSRRTREYEQLHADLLNMHQGPDRPRAHYFTQPRILRTERPVHADTFGELTL
ncbi:MAG: MFS transporter [Sphingomonadales bacterium]|nr:MAG: MFS transporter [Sphingomonadales bacterium]